MTNFDLIDAIMNGPVPLRQVFELSPGGIVVSDEEGTVVFYNQAQARRDGLRPAEVLGRKLREIYPAGWPQGVTKNNDKPGIIIHYQTMKGRAVAATLIASRLSWNGRAAGIFYQTCEPGEARPAPPVNADPAKNQTNGFDQLIGQNTKFRLAIKTGLSSAASPSPVLLSGETGTGKEMFAKGIHLSSPRAARPFVPINCAAIPQELLEGILFGTARGAFTGATDKSGLFEEAHQGTIFLDELDSLPLKLQPKLLRFLQDQKIRRVGSARELALDIKIISAISSSPEEAVKQGRLRPDLFFRLGVVVICLPPLKERPDDLGPLSDFFIAKHNATLGRKIAGLSPEVLSAFKAYDWPGNVRELEHIIEAALNVAGNQKIITPDMLPDRFSLSSRLTLRPYDSEHPGIAADIFGQMPDDSGSLKLRDKEKHLIINALTATGGNVAQAARLLDISRQLLVYKMKKHLLKREDYK